MAGSLRLYISKKMLYRNVKKSNAMCPSFAYPLDLNETVTIAV